MINDYVRPIAAAILLDLASLDADAHQAGTTWAYPLACCKSTGIGGDCQRVPGARVKERQNGYVIRLFPGDHPKVTREHIFLIPYGDEIPSGDDDFHVCLHPTEDYLNCFFAPPSGF
jgi:hypothetical protein